MTIDIRHHDMSLDELDMIFRVAAPGHEYTVLGFRVLGFGFSTSTSTTESSTSTAAAEATRSVTNAICSYTDFARRLFCGLLFRLSVTLSRFATRCGRTVAISTPRICRKISNVKTNRAVRFSADKYAEAEAI